MALVVKNITNEMSTLKAILLSTLDENLFFNELSKFFNTQILSDRVFATIVSEGLEESDSIVSYVYKTKRPYFSNNVLRDPLFKGQRTGITSEICFPVAHEGIVIATLHFQMDTIKEREYLRDDINAIKSLLNELVAPIANMKMYLAAKHLNEVLLKKIADKERELKEGTRTLTLADSYKISERPILAKSEVMLELLKHADKAALVNSNIIINGESGTGKEVLAQRIHCRSARKDNAFVKLDLSTIASGSLESALFGEEKDGVVVKNGAVEVANNGTLFIEEFHLLSSTLQAKLAVALKEKSAIRIGGVIAYRFDARIIVGSKEDLKERVNGKTLREDLFYMLNNIELKMPALRERGNDIELFVSSVLESKKHIAMKMVSPSAMEILKKYAFPGNIRELFNVVERAFILADGSIIEKGHLPELQGKVEEVIVPEEVVVEAPAYTEMTLEELEKRHIISTLEHLEGNKTKTAKTLGITVKTLYNKLHSYGMIEYLKESSLQ